MTHIVLDTHLFLKSWDSKYHLISTILIIKKGLKKQMLCQSHNCNIEQYLTIYELIECIYCLQILFSEIDLLLCLAL